MYCLTVIIGNAVTAVVDTKYPFSDQLKITITASKTFTYYVRIPSWVKNGNIAINGGGATAVAPSKGLQSIQAGAGTTTVVLNLPADIVVGGHLFTFHLCRF
jgi:DUF1680 family protein